MTPTPGALYILRATTWPSLMQKQPCSAVPFGHVAIDLLRPLPRSEREWSGKGDERNLTIVSVELGNSVQG